MHENKILYFERPPHLLSLLLPFRERVLSSLPRKRRKSGVYMTTQGGRHIKKLQSFYRAGLTPGRKLAVNIPVSPLYTTIYSKCKKILHFTVFLPYCYFL